MSEPTIIAKGAFQEGFIAKLDHRRRIAHIHWVPERAVVDRHDLPNEIPLQAGFEAVSVTNGVGKSMSLCPGQQLVAPHQFVRFRMAKEVTLPPAGTQFDLPPGLAAYSVAGLEREPLPVFLAGTLYRYAPLKGKKGGYGGIKSTGPGGPSQEVQFYHDNLVDEHNAPHAPTVKPRIGQAVLFTVRRNHQNRWLAPVVHGQRSDGSPGPIQLARGAAPATQEEEQHEWPTCDAMEM